MESSKSLINNWRNCYATCEVICPMRHWYNRTYGLFGLLS